MNWQSTLQQEDRIELTRLPVAGLESLHVSVYFRGDTNGTIYTDCHATKIVRNEQIHHGFQFKTWAQCNRNANCPLRPEIDDGTRHQCFKYTGGAQHQDLRDLWIDFQQEILCDNLLRNYNKLCSQPAECLLRRIYES